MLNSIDPYWELVVLWLGVPILIDFIGQQPVVLGKHRARKTSIVLSFHAHVEIRFLKLAWNLIIASIVPPISHFSKASVMLRRTGTFSLDVFLPPFPNSCLEFPTLPLLLATQ